MRLAALITLVLLVLSAAAVVFTSKINYAVQDRQNISAGHTFQHMVGTDELGRDRAVRTAAALLLGLFGSLCAAALASSLAVGVAVAAAFLAPWFSRVLMYVADLALTLPWIFMLMVVRSALPLTLSPLHSALLTFLLLAILGAPVFVRVNYARALAVRRAGWLLQGRASGLSSLQLIRTYVLPHLRPLFLTQFIIFVPVCLIAEANLGSLGLGISQPLPSWGSMLLELQSSAFLSSSKWIYLPMALMIVVLFAIELLMFKEEA